MADEYKECPSCALEYEDDGDVDVCPYCGYEFPQRSSGLRWVAYLLVLLMLWPAIKGIMYLLS
jgi:hypothetical protein